MQCTMGGSIQLAYFPGTLNILWNRPAMTLKKSHMKTRGRPFNETHAIARERAVERPIHLTRSLCRASKSINFIASER